MKQNKRTAPLLLIASLMCATSAFAQDEPEDAAEEQSGVSRPQLPTTIDEVVAIGRLLSNGQA
ncbi:MAG: hypothetical protein AAFN07_15745, partial [Pseudomonadota bacterium]